MEITDRSVLLVDGRDVLIDNCLIDGAVIVRACVGARVHIHDCVLKNESWHVETVDKEDPAVENKFALRGYKLVKDETRELVFDKPGDYDITC